MTPVKLKIVIELEVTVPAEEYGTADPLLTESQTLFDRGLASYLGYIDSIGNVTYRNASVVRV